MDRVKKGERPPRDSGPLTPLTPGSGDALEAGYIVWRVTQPRGDESCRWERPNGYWVSITLAPASGEVVVRDARGRIEFLSSYEGALDVAASWRG